MKSLTEALGAFEKMITQYQATCQSNGRVLGGIEAWWLNLNPLDTNQYGGINGYNRAQNLLELIQAQTFQTTEEFLIFLSDYINEGHRFKSYMRDFICETAGFTDEHVNYLAKKYQDHPSNEWGRFEFPSDAESHKAAQYLIINVIKGFYEGVMEYLDSYLCLEKKEHQDGGQKLLEYLGTKTNNKSFSL